MSLSFELNLLERQADRVFVAIYLDAVEPMRIDGVTIQIFDPSSEALSPRLTLPITGTLSGPLATKAELRSTEPLPEGCTILGTVFWDKEQVQTSCPADPGTQLELHMRGSRIGMPPRDRDIEPLSCEEIERLARALPWVGQFRCRPETPCACLDAEVVEDFAQVAADLGLDEECARWLEELMTEEEEI